MKKVGCIFFVATLGCAPSQNARLAVSDRVTSAVSRGPSAERLPARDSATAQPDAAVAAVVAPRFLVSGRLDVQSDQTIGTHTIQPGDTLYSGDTFTLTAWADRPLYLYIVGYEPDSWSSLLFPTGRDVMVPANEQIRIPQSGNPFRLNEYAGEVNLYVYASEQPITREACAELRLPWPLWQPSRALRGGSSPPPPPPPPPPTGDKRETRSPRITMAADSHIASIYSDAQAKALLRFHFRHERRPGK